jgi:hypothetical protein
MKLEFFGWRLRRSASANGEPVIDPIFSRGRRLAALGALAIALTASQAGAQDQDSVWRSIAKKTGVATDVDPPADFVVKSRPADPPRPLPVFGTPDEPDSKVMTPRELRAMDADLDSAGKKHDVLRAGFAPSAKAVAEAKAAAAEKARRNKGAKPTP